MKVDGTALVGHVGLFSFVKAVCDLHSPLKQHNKNNLGFKIKQLYSMTFLLTSQMNEKPPSQRCRLTQYEKVYKKTSLLPSELQRPSEKLKGRSQTKEGRQGQSFSPLQKQHTSLMLMMGRTDAVILQSKSPHQPKSLVSLQEDRSPMGFIRCKINCRDQKHVLLLWGCLVPSPLRNHIALVLALT